MSEHTASHTRVNIAAPGKPPKYRYTGRCSCGHQTFTNYSTAALAEGAIQSIHIRDMDLKATTGAVR